MLNVINHQWLSHQWLMHQSLEMQIRTSESCQATPSGMTVIRKTGSASEDAGRLEPRTHCQGNKNSAAAVQKREDSSSKMDVGLPCDPAFPPWGDTQKTEADPQWHLFPVGVCFCHVVSNRGHHSWCQTSYDITIRVAFYVSYGVLVCFVCFFHSSLKS